MKILIYNWRDIKHPFSGGAETMLYEHAKYWREQGAEVTWFASSFKNAKPREIIDGITFIRRGSHYTVHLFGLLYSLFGKFGKPDIIIDNFHFIPFFSPLIWPKKRIIAIIHEIAGTIWFSNAPLPAAIIGYIIEPFIFKMYRGIPFITVSESTRKDLIRLGIHEKNIHIIHNGVTSFFVNKNLQKEKDPTFLFLGRISKDKGIIDSIKAFKSVSRDAPLARLWIIGKEEKAHEMDEIIREECGNSSEVISRIKYWGYVTEKTKFELLTRAWILVHPSQKEGWGLTVIEAAYCGVPTIGYNVEGLRDSIRDGKTGILVEPGVENLSYALSSLIRNKKDYESMCRNAKEWAQEFSWGKSSKKSWELIVSRENTL